MAEAKKVNPSKVVTGKVRLSYVNLFTPRADSENGNAEPKYSVQLLIPKTDTVTIAKIEKALAAVKADPKSVTTWGGKFLAGYKTPLRDGDTERDTDKSPEYKGMYFLNASSSMKPQVVDADVNPVMDQTEVYSGCYGRVSINLYAFNQKGGIGIAAGLNNVQKIADGEPLGGRSTAEEDFGAEADDDFLG